MGQSFYHGNKESEKPCFRELLTKTKAASQKITADALHLSPQTTQTIVEAGGIFMIGLKENQKTLLEDMKTSIHYLKPICEEDSIEKGHGRIAQRQYKHYDISGEYFEKRWENTKFQSLFTVQRTRRDIQSGNESDNTDYYISNGKYDAKEDYFGAIRGHWSVEVYHHTRDVTLKEDQVKTKEKSIHRVLASCRTLVIKLLKKAKPKNMIAKLEEFQDNFTKLLKWLKTIKFL